MKILILGANGMLGHRLYINGKLAGLNVFGTVRKKDVLEGRLNRNLFKDIIPGVEASDVDSVERILTKIKPDVIINCIGIVKQILDYSEPEKAIYLNSLFPHKMARLSKKYNARFIHVSTDCVFNGQNGNYKESVPADANDLYGLSKLLGEVNTTNSVTIRTSLIGHEINTKHSLLEWFLSQKGPIKGFKNFYFSGMTTEELSNVIFNFILPNKKLSGIFHISSHKISKYDLLMLIAVVYMKKIKIIPSPRPICDRSLNSYQFRRATGYSAPSWDEMIKKMYNSQKNN